MTIYNLMLKVHTLRMTTTLAYSNYKKGQKYYARFEDEAITVIHTLYDIDYITSNEYREYIEQLQHIFRMYKRH